MERTWKLASDAHGLTIIAMLDEDDATFNPYSSDGLLINQKMASWILTNLEYPYQNCSTFTEIMGSCRFTLISWVGRSLDMHDEKSTERGYQLLSHFIERGEPLNHLIDGFTPLHEAVLYGNSRYLGVLLSAGADKSVRTDKPGEAYHDLDLLEYVEYLDENTEYDYTDILNVIGSYSA